MIWPKTFWQRFQKPEHVVIDEGEESEENDIDSPDKERDIVEKEEGEWV